jgi:hypothetical protein
MVSPGSIGRATAAALFILCGPVEARSLQVRASYPIADAIVNGNSIQYVIRFDGLVDHAGSRLEILADGKVVMSLTPTADSEPDVLAATAPLLTPGPYQLRWQAKSVPDGEFSDGLIRFVVAP